MIKFVVNGRKPIPSNPPTRLCCGSFVRSWPDRHEVWLRHRTVRCLHGAHQRNPVRSCSTPVSAAQGKRITTIEGLSPSADHPRCRKPGSPSKCRECGYCQSGQIMQAAALLAKNKKPTREQIVRHMDGNICRCGTYPRIVAPSSAPRRRRSHAPRDEDQPPRVLKTAGALTFSFSFAGRVSEASPTAPLSSTPGYRSRPTTRSPW